MDLRSRTVPERPVINREPSEDTECGKEADARGSSTVILEDDDLDLTILFEPEDSSGNHGGTTHIPQPLSPVGARARETFPLARWPMPTRKQGEPVNDFDIAMRGFMDEQIYPQRREQMSESLQNRNKEDMLHSERSNGQRQNVSSTARGDHEREKRDDFGHGAAGGSVVRDQPPRQGHRPALLGQGEGGRNEGNLGDFEYDRLLPQNARPRGRAEAHRPAPHFEIPRHEYRIPEQFFSEPRPFFPTFSGRPSEWGAFWLKFELMARRYDWSLEKQREQLLFCLKDEAMNFAASLGPEIREDILLFSQALRDRFSHRTPPEVVRGYSKLQ